jgi:hypothetical protein
MQTRRTVAKVDVSSRSTASPSQPPVLGIMFTALNRWRRSLFAPDIGVDQQGVRLAVDVLHENLCAVPPWSQGQTSRRSVHSIIDDTVAASEKQACLMKKRSSVRASQSCGSYERVPSSAVRSWLPAFFV